MERAKLIIPPSPRQPRVSKGVGIYYITSKRYSRKHCLDVMKALDRNVRIIYIRLGKVNFEIAKRSGRSLVKGRFVFHFNVAWKSASVETSMPDPPPDLPRLIYND
jgi:hypothetical protein